MHSEEMVENAQPGMQSMEHEIAEKVVALKKRLLQQIDVLPDNPRINRLSKNCFTMKSGDLFSSGNWGVFYHDYAAQYRKLVEWTEAMNFGDMVRRLNKVINEGTVYTNRSNTGEKYIFHPEVRKMLGEVMA